MDFSLMSKRIRFLRTQAGRTQKEMADLLDCTPNHYQKIEYGKVNLPSSSLVFLADFYDVSADYLLGRTDRKERIEPRTEGSNAMAKKSIEKTNVMRTLEQKKVPYTPHTYPHDDGAAPDGVSVAQSLGLDPAAVFKTLVVRGASGNYYVFDIPVAHTLDLKKAAKAVGEKSVSMLPSKELLPLTGYVHGGCSPVGMKKHFPTTFHQSCLEQETLYVSAGKIGFQVEVKPADLLDLVSAATADLIVED